MQWADAVSTRPDFYEALEECRGALKGRLTAAPDLLLAFASPHHAGHFDKVPEVLSDTLKPRLLAGCSGGGIIGSGREIEAHPGLSLVAAVLPEVSLRAAHVEEGDLPDPDASPRAWVEKFGATGRPHFLILADPFSFDPEDLARGLDYAFPSSTKVGGLASGALRPGANALFLDRRSWRSGAVVVTFNGNVEIDSIVAQGCRPVGPPFQVTQCERNLLIEIDGQRPLAVLEKMIESLSPEDRELVQSSLFIGLLNDSLKGTGDYLIRNLVGLDPKNGIIGVGAMLRPGQTLQFHVRDRVASAQDLGRRLEAYSKESRLTRPQGALLFSCMGRGKGLYKRPDHDSELFLKTVGRIPLGGFFCNGEIGPVQGSTYLHGYTSCFGIFRPAR